MIVHIFTCSLAFSSAAQAHSLLSRESYLLLNAQLILIWHRQSSALVPMGVGFPSAMTPASLGSSSSSSSSSFAASPSFNHPNPATLSLAPAPTHLMESMFQMRLRMEMQHRQLQFQQAMRFENIVANAFAAPSTPLQPSSRLPTFSLSCSLRLHVAFLAAPDLWMFLFDVSLSLYKLHRVIPCWARFRLKFCCARCSLPVLDDFSRVLIICVRLLLDHV